MPTIKQKKAFKDSIDIIDTDDHERYFLTDALAEMSTWQCVYIAKSGKYGKIGIAFNPSARIESIQTGNPEEVILYAFYRIPNAKTEEEYLHDKFKDKHVRGEWFLLDNVDVDWITQRLFEKVNQYISI